jgi:hypothetical protein
LNHRDATRRPTGKLCTSEVVRQPAVRVEHPMSNELASAMAAIMDRLRAACEQDPLFRDQLRAVARAVVDLTEPTVPPAPSATDPAAEPSKLEPSSSGPPEPSPLPPAASPAEPAQPDRRPVMAHLGVAATAPAIAARATVDVTTNDLPLVVQRLRLKAEGSRWAATRRRRMAERADFDTEIDPVDRSIIEQAKRLPDCFLWMNHPSGPSPSDLQLLDDLAGCFATTADAVDLVLSVADGTAAGPSDVFERSLELLAEAQSALRAAVASVGQKQDIDQFGAYLWLRDECYRSQVFVQRHMWIDDQADPASWPDVAERVHRADEQVQAVRRRTKEHQANLNKLRYHLKPIMAADAGDRRHDWEVIFGTVDRMVSGGMPPSNAEVRDLLLPVVDAVPDVDLPEGFGRVLREIDAFLASRPNAAPEVTAEPTEQVKAVAALLDDKTLVLIGGARRPQAHQALRRLFRLKEVDWVETRPHESVTVFEPHIARAGVAVVVLAIRWSSHAFGDVQAYCDRYGKPLVRLPGGYNPNQVAAQILAQCGDRLAAAR